MDSEQITPGAVDTALQGSQLAVVRPGTGKPLMRGWLDLIAILAIIPAAAWLIAYARPGLPTLSAAVYSTGLLFLFAMSATYHVPVWAPGPRLWLRRADHSAIYVQIAGSYTPVCLVVLEPAVGIPLLWTVWIIAIAGLVKSVLWPRAPRAVTAGIYVAFGCLIFPFLPALVQSTGAFALIMFALGGVFYIFGAAIYSKKWFDFRPAVFGYHEVFHIFVIAAAAVHFLAMWRILV